MSAATYHPGCVQDVAWRGDGGQQTSGRRLTDYRHTQRPEVLPAATVPGCVVTVCSELERGQDDAMEVGGR